MKDFLGEIVRHKRIEVEAFKKRSPAEASSNGKSGGPGGFKAALSRPGLNIIAEIKKASPSRGVIAHDFNPLATARAYEKGGAAAVSVLTEEKYFQGNIGIMKEVAATVKLPVLRKDFIIDPCQIREAAFHNASAALLIAAILDDKLLSEFLLLARSLALDALVEVHTVEEARRALACGAGIVGINNRDLATFKTDLNVTLRVMETLAGKGLVTVSESGIRTAEDARRLMDAGINALLIGETLMTAKDPAAKIKELAL